MVWFFKHSSRFLLKDLMFKVLRSWQIFFISFPVTNWLLRAAVMKLWWREIPTSKTLWDLFDLIKSIQVGFIDWTNVGLFIKLFRTTRFLLIENLLFVNILLTMCHKFLFATNTYLDFEKILVAPVSIQFSKVTLLP